jgi:UDP:flavonoid glycosyltransferase YjiC (YdhE family)
MRVLMALWDGSGTVPVELGVARRLVAAGHSVTVLAEPSMQAAVLAAGARFRSWERAPQQAEQAVADWECTNPLTLFRRLLDRLITGPSGGYAADVRAVVASQTVDVAVVDVALMGALVGTESLGIPTAVSIPGCYLRPTPAEPAFGLGLRPATGPVTRARDQVLPRVLDRVWDLGLADLNAARRDVGLPPVRHVWSQVDRAAVVLVLTAECFDFPPARRPGAVRCVGPVLDDPGWADTDVELPDGDEPLVVVGLSGGRTRGQSELLRRVVAALADAPVRAVIPTGPALPTLPSPSPRIRIVAAAPHSRLLPQASVVITHGGHGTVIKALAAGCPTLVLPLGRDQPDNAARVEWHHAGLRLPATSSSARIRQAVLTLLNDPSYAASAGALGARIRAETDDRRIVTAIETLAA